MIVPIMGVTTIIHVAVIGTGRLLRALDAKSKMAYVTIAVIALFISASVASIVQGALMDGNANHRLVGELVPCVPFEKKAAHNKVVLRIDDIQAHAYTDVQIRMMSDAFNQSIPLVLGVIPYAIAEDVRMVRFLREHECHAEIAQHGWDHNYENGSETPEFGNVSEEEAYTLITRGKELLQEVTDQPVVTFIPPNNRASRGTLQALMRTGILVNSATGTGEFDYDAKTYDFIRSRFIPASEVLAECDSHFAKDGLCIIMIHPQDYMQNGAFDEEKYQQYKDLIAGLKKRNVSFVTMRDIVDAEGRRNLSDGRLPIMQDRVCKNAIASQIIPGAQNNPSDVAILQAALKRYAGFPDLPLSGVYDTSTQEAVAAYQMSIGNLLSPRAIGNKLLCEKK